MRDNIKMIVTVAIFTISFLILYNWGKTYAIRHLQNVNTEVDNH